MSDPGIHEYILAQREIQDSMNQIRVIRGLDPISYVQPTIENITPELPLCSFCGKGKNQVRAMIAGPASNICCECVVLCSEMFKNDNETNGRC